MDDKQVMHAMSVDDAYQVVRTLSGGPTGTTELVTIDGSGPFVRKKIPTDMANRAVWAILADCDCPYLPRVWATYELPDQFVVVCDFVAGTTLKDHVSSLERLAPREAAGLAENVCAAAESLHAHGVVHRDISPANVIVSSDGAHLIDLGIARTRFAHEDREGTHLGTWGFAAPEQYGFAQTDARSDVYSIGRLLGYMLTGASPDDDEYERLLQDRDVVPEPLAAVIARACDFEPSSRFQTADELARAARDALLTEDTGEMAPGNVPAQENAERTETHQAQGNPRRKAHIRSRIVAATAGFAVIAALATALVATNCGGLGPSEDGQPEPATSIGSTSDADEPSSDSGSYEAEKTESADEANVSSAPSVPNTNDLTASVKEASSSTPSERAEEAVPSKADTAVTDKDQTDGMVKIVDSWWEYRSGTLSYIYGVTNTSDDILVNYPEVRATGKAGDGSIVHTQTNTFAAIYPGETVYYTFSTLCNTAPETVEFTAVEPRASFLETDSEGKPVFDFSNLTDTTVEYATTITGELTAERLPANRNPIPAFVTVILRDEAGAIVGGTTAMVSTVAEGESVPFEVTLIEAPDYASFEVHARTW